MNSENFKITQYVRVCVHLYTNFINAHMWDHVRYTVLISH